MNRTYIYAGAAVLGAGALYFLARKVTVPGVGSLAESAAWAGVDAVNGAFVGTVKGIGAAFGVPDTNQSKCAADLARGDKWAASFSCPAGTFIGSVWNSTAANEQATEGARQIDRIIERQQALALGLNVVTNGATGEAEAYYDAMGNRYY